MSFTTALLAVHTVAIIALMAVAFTEGLRRKAARRAK